MKKILVMAALFAFSFDVAMDSFDADCLVASQPVHANVGDLHAVNPPAAAAQKLENAPTFVRLPDDPSLPTKDLFDKSVFHPPIPRA